ncbi:MAG: Fe-S cluster assembly ATPase SufC [Conexivisphaerales archaeon]|jgi:Fe-S cluster assembly ATP-binding protein
MPSVLEIDKVGVQVANKRAVYEVSMTIRQGEIHALMGPNGSGKSSLSYALMGHPKYKIVAGDIRLDGVSLLPMTPTERARHGIFLALQYPVEVSGVTLFNFLRSSYSAIKQGGKEDVKTLAPIIPFRKLLQQKLDLLKVDNAFTARYLNEGLSGGEKKRSEILQMAMMEPKIAVLDEIDSGLDIDAVKIVAETLNRLMGPQLGLLLITHYIRILQFVEPEFVHVMADGRIVAEGGPELARKLEEKGYGWLSEKPEAPP